MNLKQIAASEEFRADLAQVLQNENLQLALQALSEDNMPDLAIKAVPGMDPLHAIALDAAKRAGAQSMIKRLRSLPYASTGLLERARAVGQPWEWIEPESTEAPTKTRKTSRR